MAEVIVPVPTSLAPTQKFFTDLGFSILSIFPADDPREAVLQGYGLRLRLLRDSCCQQPTIRLLSPDGPATLHAPNGTVVELRAELDPPLELPDLVEELAICHAAADEEGVVGRAGMVYRDLIPGRAGGRFIASHIRIPDGGLVPDMVHYHKVRFQMIFCVKGWVKVVYEDQGEPFVLQAGDCVVQPPEIRHRVLESSVGLEVLELGSPAEHFTLQDLQMQLPTPNLNPDRTFGGTGQRFVWHQAANAKWNTHPSLDNFERTDTQINQATEGLASVYVARRCDQTSDVSTGIPLKHDGELVFRFVTAGSAVLRIWNGADVTSRTLGVADSFLIPAGVPHSLGEFGDSGFEMAEVMLPAVVNFEVVK